MRTLIILVAILLALYIARYLWQKKGLSNQQITTKFILYGLAAAMVLLMLTGRVPWLMGVLGAALPLVARFLPLLNSLYRRYQTQARNPGGGQTSSVQSRYLRMTLDHDSGEMDGEVLVGRLRGSKLSELPMAQLITLFGDFADDRDSQALLQTYMDRAHPDWREHAADSQAGGEHADHSVSSGQMSAQEARDILGVTSDASEEQIVAAHRRLMQKLHPDRGGSSYLAAKINQAKEFLLKPRK